MVGGAGVHSNEFVEVEGYKYYEKQWTGSIFCVWSDSGTFNNADE